MGELALILGTAVLAGISLLGLDPVQTLMARFGAFIWGAIILLSLVMLRGKSHLRILLLIHAGSVLTGTGTLLNDAKHVPYGFFGGFTWAAALIASFIFGLLYFAQFALPPTVDDGWSEGWRLLTRHFIQTPIPEARPARKPPGGKRSEKENGSRPKYLALPSSFSALGAGILHSYKVLALTKGSGFSRPGGPGFVMLFRKERVGDALDLRKHLRSETVKANTRDGIPVETKVHVMFRVRPAENEREATRQEDSLPHPYDKEAIFLVSYANSIADREEMRPWKERVGPAAAALLTDELAKRTLDDLCQGDENGIPVIEAIKDRMKGELALTFVQQGIEVLALDLGHLDFHEKVVDQRLESWQADWKRKITMRRASGDAEVLRRIKEARARTQIDIIQNITQNIHELRQSGESDLSDIILLRMIEALERAMSDESVQMLLPHEIMLQLMVDSTAKLQAWIADRTGETGQ